MYFSNEKKYTNIETSCYIIFQRTPMNAIIGVAFPVKATYLTYILRILDTGNKLISQ